MPDTDSVFVQRQKDAALARINAERAKRRELERIVIGDHGRNGWLGEVVPIGDDWLVQVCRRDRDPIWETVVAGKADHWQHDDQERALLHLIARRHTTSATDAYTAAVYAARVLGIPEQ